MEGSESDWDLEALDGLRDTPSSHDLLGDGHPPQGQSFAEAFNSRCTLRAKDLPGTGGANLCQQIEHRRRRDRYAAVAFGRGRPGRFVVQGPSSKVEEVDKRWCRYDHRGGCTCQRAPRTGRSLRRVAVHRQWLRGEASPFA